jgi:HemY protein
MRFIAWIVVLSIAAVGMAWVTANNTGHVTVYLSNYRIDTSLNLVIFMTMGLFVVAYFLLRLIDGIIYLPQQAASYRVRQRETKAIKAISESIDHLFAGRYAKALKSAYAGTLFPSVADVAYLISANASHRLKRYAERDVYLSKVTGGSHQQSRQVMTAEMLLDQRDSKGALEIIRKLQEGGARQFLVQHIALRANQLEENWEEVIRLTQVLAKREILHPLIARTRMQEALMHFSERKDITSVTLRSKWKELTAIDQAEPAIAEVFAKAFIRVGDKNQAKVVLEEALDKTIDADLLEIYPECVEQDRKAETILLLIKKVESWLIKYPAEPALHLALGRLCAQQALWGKSKSSLGQVVKSPRADRLMQARAHIVLSAVNEELEESDEASVHYKAAVKLLME